MRIFLIWPDTSPEMVNFISGLKRSGHEVVYWTGTKKNEGKFPEIILHDHYDAWIGIPPKELAGVEFDPPGEDLIKKLAGVESIIMTMMNKHFEGMCVDERKNLYYSLLGYWWGVLNKFKPEAIVFSAPPHPTFSYLIFELARLLKIKTIVFYGTSVAGRMIWCDDFWRGSELLLKELANNKDKKFVLDDLHEDLRLYYKFHTDENNDATPDGLKGVMKKNNLGNKIILKTRIVFKSLKDFTVLKKVPLYLKKLLVSNIQKEYRRFCNLRPDFSQKFIYVPLHYQPECNTSPLGGAFVNQILMIKILAAALPPGWLIYVKEHPVQWLAFGLNYTDGRYPGYYRQISQIKNVQLIPIKTDSFFLIKQAQAVATVTGTAGWEAILRRKPVLIFGYPWYKDCPGVFRINDAESCRLAIEKITEGYKPNEQSVINYFKCLELVSIHGYRGEDFPGYAKITKQSCLDNILTVINQELKI
ncbi:MAG: hypothetical protein WCV41_01185 [Patescibacteria group bacterium]